MSIIDAITLFGIMGALAALPSTGVALVVTRAATAGVGNGLAVALGIVAGDLVFAGLAVLGLSVLAEAMGGLFAVIKYVGAVYLIWFGVSLLKPREGGGRRLNLSAGRGGLVTSLLSGFVFTLGDVKALLFYGSLFPAFVEVAALNAADFFAVAAITLVAVGGVKCGYAFMAGRLAAVVHGWRYQGVPQKPRVF